MSYLPQSFIWCISISETDRLGASDPGGLDGNKWISGLGEVKKRVRLINVEKLRERWLPVPLERGRERES